jgi:hypothetical protein
MSDPIVPAIKKYDEALHKELSEQYELSIQFAPDGFSFCIFHPKVNKYLSIETINFAKTNSYTGIEQIFEQHAKTNEWVLLNYLRTKIYYENEFSTLIPASLYNEKEKHLYATFNYSIPDGHVCKSDFIKSMDAFLVYTISENLLKKFQQLFPANDLFSSSTNLLESLILQYKNAGPDKKMFVNVRSTFIDIVVLEENKVQFFNSFQYHTSDDFIYFIIFVIEQLSLNPETIELIFSGMINKNSSLLENVYQYVRNIHFQKIPSVHKYSYIFTEVPAHYYYNLLSQGL